MSAASANPSVALPYPIIVDTREQAPYSFAGIQSDAKEGGGNYAVEVHRRGLGSGDYSVAGLEEIVAVERKSLQDLYGTIGQGRERFVRELERLSEFRYAAVVIEADWRQIVFDPPDHSRLTPRAVHRSIVAWAQRYPRVHWWPCPDRRFAELTTFRILKRAMDEHVKALKLRKPNEGYWRKLPCPQHVARFELECPACNGKNSEWVPTGPKVNDLAGDCIELLKLNDELGVATTQAERRWRCSAMIDKAVEIARGYLRRMELDRSTDFDMANEQ